MKTQSKKRTASKRQPGRKKLIPLTGAQTLGSAAKLREKIVKSLTAGETLTIDASTADAIDLGSLQVLIAAQRAAEDSGQSLTILAPEGSAMMKLAQSAGFFSSRGAPLIPEAARWIGSEEATS